MINKLIEMMEKGYKMMLLTEPVLFEIKKCGKLILLINVIINF